MNIKEIKKKLDDLAYWGDISPNEIEKDVEYLLSIIEQAEKSLELFEQLYDTNINKASSEVIETVKTMASKALQAIRK